jgi:hypothetical protein
MAKEPTLVGWDDGKIYFYLNGEEYCVSDEPALFEQIVALCRRYYEQKMERKAEGREAHEKS